MKCILIHAHVLNTFFFFLTPSQFAPEQAASWLDNISSGKDIPMEIEGGKELHQQQLFLYERLLIETVKIIISLRYKDKTQVMKV